jgi:pyruvate dehydrogenase E1 component alpha subunit
LARAASSSSAKPTGGSAKKSAEPAVNAGNPGENFELRSLQKAFEKDRRFKAGEAELLHFYEQMLLIRRFEE